MGVNVLEIRLVNGDRPLKAFADVRIGDSIIRDWRVEKHNGQRAAVSSPVSSWRNPNTRQIQFKGIVTLPPELKQAVELAVLTAYQRAMEKYDGTQPI